MNGASYQSELSLRYLYPEQLAPIPKPNEIENEKENPGKQCESLLTVLTTLLIGLFTSQELANTLGIVGNATPLNDEESCQEPFFIKALEPACSPKELRLVQQKLFKNLEGIGNKYNIQTLKSFDSVEHEGKNNVFVSLAMVHYGENRPGDYQNQALIKNYIVGKETRNLGFYNIDIYNFSRDAILTSQGRQCGSGKINLFDSVSIITERITIHRTPLYKERLNLEPGIEPEIEQMYKDKVHTSSDRFWMSRLLDRNDRASHELHKLVNEIPSGRVSKSDMKDALFAYESLSKLKENLLHKDRDQYLLNYVHEQEKMAKESGKNTLILSLRGANHLLEKGIVNGQYSPLYEESDLVLYRPDLESNNDPLRRLMNWHDLLNQARDYVSE